MSSLREKLRKNTKTFKLKIQSLARYFDKQVKLVNNLIAKNKSDEVSTREVISNIRLSFQKQVKFGWFLFLTIYTILQSKQKINVYI
jgi:hypothetical protein